MSLGSPVPLYRQFFPPLPPGSYKQRDFVSCAQVHLSIAPLMAVRKGVLPTKRGLQRHQTAQVEVAE